MSETNAQVPLESDATGNTFKPGAKRRSVLDLAPLELACMNALWPLGEASVRDIRLRMAATSPRAYTTIMTIMDRLARKGVVERRRAGRAWLYRPNLSVEEARAHAVAQVVEGFFGGSAAALAAQLNVSTPSVPAGLREMKNAPESAIALPEQQSPQHSSAAAGDAPASCIGDTPL